MSNSSLISYTKLSPNHSGQRTHSVDRITPHCVVGQLSCETICDCFPAGRGASCNYGIGKDGRIALCVDEDNRSWCSSSNANDQRAITIECASDKTEPYAMTDAVYASLIDLCTDICKRYGKTKLLWFADKEKTLAYNPAADEMIITVIATRFGDEGPGAPIKSTTANKEVAPPQPVAPIAAPVAPAQSSAAATSPVSTFNDNDDDAFSEIVNFFKK